MRKMMGVLFVAVRVWAEVSANVPAELPNYDYIDRLEAYGCAMTTFRSFKPQVHADLLEAMTRYAEKECRAPEWLLEERQLMGRKLLQSEASLKAFVFNGDVLALSGMSATVAPSYSLNEGRSLFSAYNLLGELAIHAATGGGFRVCPLGDSRAFTRNGYPRIERRSILFSRGLRQVGEK